MLYQSFSNPEIIARKIEDIIISFLAHHEEML